MTVKLSLPLVAENVRTPVEAALLGTARAAVNVDELPENPLVMANDVLGKSALSTMPKLQLVALAALAQLQAMAPLDKP